VTSDGAWACTSKTLGQPTGPACVCSHLGLRLLLLLEVGCLWTAAPAASCCNTRPLPHLHQLTRSRWAPAPRLLPLLLLPPAGAKHSGSGAAPSPHSALQHVRCTAAWIAAAPPAAAAAHPSQHHGSALLRPSATPPGPAPAWCRAHTGGPARGWGTAPRSPLPIR
jgi:hypothetical protein